MKDRGVSHLMSALTHNGRITSINFELDLCHRLSEATINNLAVVIQSNPMLTNLALDIKKLTNIWTQNLSRAIQDANNIKNFSIKIGGRGNNILGIICCIPKVTDLLLEISEDTLKENDLPKVLESFQKMERLSRLTIISFPNLKFTYQGYANLLDHIACLPILNHLELHFDNEGNMPFEVFGSLRNLLMASKTLNSLVLQFNRYIKNEMVWRHSMGVNEEALNKIAHVLAAAIHLQHFSLRLAEEYDISGESISQVFDSLGQLRGLSQLEFGIRRCPISSDSALQCIGNILKPDSSISSLVLMFSNSQGKVTDRGLGALASGLSNCVNLTRFALVLPNSLISNEGMLQVTEALYACQKLSNVTLKLDQCEMISDQGCYCLAELLKVRRSIQYFDLSLDLVDIAEEAKEAIRNIAKTRKFTRFTFSCAVPQEF
eukprot:TRINITY_DN17442_c0_g1_i1.p1 TRINITY_DN17442_c0_g1~~TRINITY_DN17442_c0_g1_i1.p1  ORF type:complete len:433 (+),score=56.16 TRINITY_DN17442_c0_g1_i1:644-1942(+)